MKDPLASLQRFLPPLCAVLLLVAAFAPYQEKKHRLRVVPGVWPAAESLLVAGDTQALPANRFQLIEIPWPSAVMRAFGSGAADVAVVTFDNVLRMREAGQNFRVLKVLNESAGADAIMAQGAVRQLQDLKGQRVGIERSAGTYLLLNALESAGMTMADIEAIPMFQSEMEHALQSGQVMAVVAAEPWLTKLHGDGLHSLYDSRQLKIPIMYLLVASERACASSRDELVFLLKVQAEQAARIWSGKTFPGMDAMLRREKVNAAELAAGLGRLHPLTRQENSVLMKRLPQLALQMEAQMIHCGILKSKLPAREWIDGSFNQEASH